jgi:5-methylcytosine-specific restriction endonuclease McrA
MATVLLTPFVENSSAQDAHLALKQAVKTSAQAEHCAVIWFQEVFARKLYKDLGYASIYLYADRELDFSASKTTNFLKLARTLDDLPQLKKELADGEIGYTKACEIIKVASPDNLNEWMEEARNTPRRELARKVARAKQNVADQQKNNPAQGQLLAPVKPTVPKAAAKHKVILEMSTQQHARYESLREKLHKIEGVPSGASTVELLLAGLASLVESGGTQEYRATSPAQIHVHQCPECEKATITTRGGDTQLTEKEFERLSCDAQIQTPGKPNRATIKPSIKRQALSRDQHRCQAPGCRNTWFLEVHHIIPRRLGGTNDLNNLTTLCSACHSYLHEKSGRNFRPPHGDIDGRDEAVSF